MHETEYKRLEEAEEILFDAMRKVAEETLSDVSDKEIAVYLLRWSDKKHGEEITIYAPVIANTIITFLNMYTEVRRFLRRKGKV